MSFHVQTVVQPKELLEQHSEVELDIRQEDLATWRTIFTNGFQRPFHCTGLPDFQDIALFDSLLMELESIEHHSKTGGIIALSFSQLQRVLSVMESMQHYPDVNSKFRRAVEKCEKMMLEISAPVRAQSDDLNTPVGSVN